MTQTRRDFLRLSGMAAGLAVAVPVRELFAQQPPAALEPEAFLHVGTDGIVTIWVIRLEMGQGVRTLLPMMIAEELEADWTKIRIEQAAPGGKFQKFRLHTSGSGSSSETFMRLRTAGAAAREMLIAAAAVEWNVDARSCRAQSGAVVHVATGRRRDYGALAAAAALLPVPATPTLKDASTFRLLGKPMRRVDGPDIVTGRVRYGLDVRVPGILFASIERAPTLGGTLVRFDATAAKKVPGVRHVIRTTKGMHPGVAVIADDTWSALRGRAALTIEWDAGPQRTFDSDRFIEALPDAFEQRQFKVRHDGDAIAALGAASRRLEATYIYPFQAHAPLETMNCTAHVRAGEADIWVPTQTDVRTLEQAARVTGLPPDRIHVHCALMGGGFGRRLFADFVAEAAELSQGVNKPVQVLWTRADDMRHGYFQPATAERFTAGVDAGGALTGIVHKTTSSSLTIYDVHNGRNLWTGPPPAAKADDVYESDESPWGAFDNPYAIPNLRVDCADVTSPVPTGPWRAVEYPSTVFGRESFLDELAHMLSKDSIALRLELLPRGVRRLGSHDVDRARLARVLEAARERSGWNVPLRSAERRMVGRGVAANVYHGRSYIAMVADVSVAPDLSDIRVERIVTVVDCGVALNPLGVDGQTESGITWGLSAALLGKMDFRGGAPVQGSFADFHVIRIDRMPKLDTVILDSGAAPGGFGEHSVPTVAPAVANALFAATGKRLRDLPLTPEKLQRA